MLSRRHFRIKVMNVLYAWAQESFKELDEAEKSLFKEIDTVYSIYLFCMQSLCDLVNYAEDDLANIRSKFIYKEEHELASDKLLENRVMVSLINNSDLYERVKKEKIAVNLDRSVIKDIFTSLKTTDTYKEYLLNEERSRKDDLYIIEFLFLDCLISNEVFHQLMEDHWMSWEEDQSFVVKLILKTLERASYKPHKNHLISKKSKYWNQEEDFVKTLLEKTIFNKKTFEEYINKNTKNWELERITTLDSILLNMAICELMYFNNIPARVSLDEYIEIAKEYSTPKSKEFINGLLDKIMKDLVNDGTINSKEKQII